MLRNFTLFTLIGILLFLCSSCSQKAAEPPELNPQQNQIQIFFPEITGEIISLDLSELNALEGLYSGLEMIYSGDDYQFTVRLPAIEKFQVWVGLCTAEGCIIEYQSSPLPLTLESSDYDSVYDIFNEQLVHPEIVLKTPSGESYKFTDFVININEFSCDDNIVHAAGSFSGFVHQQNDKPFLSSFKINDYEIDHRFVE
ncbi:MAG: hypothetical protein APR63_13760 [Desulfuromonas sp. SDB]|nr:MAG: hypothetical protein APR63_13760 [Desulfuromonas sp. SDB]